MQVGKLFIASAFAVVTAACSAGTDAPNAVSLFDAPMSQNFVEDGAAYFTLSDGVLETRPEANERYKLRTKESFGDFDMSVEFMVDADTNSGLYIRCENPENVNPGTCYEINIYETNKDEGSRTGSIYRLTPQMVDVPTAGKWSRLDIRAEGPRIIVKVNGETTVDIVDEKLKAGIMAIQYAEGGKLLKMRNFSVTPL